MDMFKPHYLFHATKPPEFVVNAEQKANYGSEWTTKYQHQAFPKVLYAKPPVDGAKCPEKTVKSEEELVVAEAAGWAETPAAFEPGYVKPAPQPTPQDLEAAKASLEAENADLKARLAELQSKKPGKV